MLPKVKIKYGKLIDPFLKVYVSSKYEGYIFLSQENMEEKIKIFKTSWSKYEEKFFDTLSILNLNFKRNLIEVFIVSAIDRDMSSPLIIRSRYDEREFVTVLIHELIHVLFSDNKLRTRFNNETQRTINHVYTFALMTYLFKDVFGEEDRLADERKKSSPDKNQEYHKAWSILDEEGYETIIQEIKNQHTA